LKPLDHYWNGWHLLTLLLLPLSAIFCLLVTLRRRLYRWGVLGSTRLEVPVVVIGNLSVGGTGKTPLAIWLVQWLRSRGLSPGIITRGYGGQAGHWPQRVEADSPPTQVGDEAVLLSRRGGCPVYAGPDRIRSARALLSEQPCDIIISDDGLQHYAMQRDLELVVIDGERRFGNGLCLPAGPLREPASRLKSVDLVLINGNPRPGESAMQVSGGQLLPVNGTRPPGLLADLQGREVEAVAGIGNPERFFHMLEAAGLFINRHRFPDHHPFTAEDLAAFSGKTVIMTEKDAVKCGAFANDQVWYVPADAEPDQDFVQQLEALIDRLIHG
jgi:tetraacyldisaccharide 4'-kinase